MTGFLEPFPDLVSAYPAGSDDPLGESVIAPDAPWFRVFEPRETRIVIGRGQDPTREVLCEHARADGIPIHRRISGGGAVVLAPGMVVVALRLPVDAIGPNAYFARVNAMLIPIVAQLAGVVARCRGHGDLAIDDGGTARKILGASLRQTSQLALYLGVFLVSGTAADAALPARAEQAA
jgi:lipoate-protein ligase A